MTRFRKVPKYRYRMTRFQVPNTDTVGTQKIPNPSSADKVWITAIWCQKGETKALQGSAGTIAGVGETV